MVFPLGFLWMKLLIRHILFLHLLAIMQIWVYFVNLVMVLTMGNRTCVYAFMWSSLSKSGILVCILVHVFMLLCGLCCPSLQYWFILWYLKILILILFAGGALKPTDVENLWVHVTCAWFRPEVAFSNHEKMEPATGIFKIPTNSFMKVQCGWNGSLDSFRSLIFL